MNIIIFGPPGSGKGTQSKKIADEFKLMHISTGDLLRDEIKKGTEIGKNLDSMGSGKLVGDDIVIDLVKKKIEENPKKGFIFDGFPRTVKQAAELSKIIDVDKVIMLMVNDKEAVKRILKRGEKSERVDDNEKVAIKRLQEYKDNTQPLKPYYSLKGILHTIDGEGTVDEVFSEIKKLLS